MGGQRAFVGETPSRSGAVSKMMDRLMAMRLIEVVREDPPSRFVQLSGTTLIAFWMVPTMTRLTSLLREIQQDS